MIKYYLDATIVISLLNVLTILRHAGWPQNMVPLDTVSTVYHSIDIHEQPRKVNFSKNIKSLHFDPGKLEPLKKHLFWSAIELEFNVYVALSTLWYFSRGHFLFSGWKLRFLVIKVFFFILGKLLFCICKYFCNECLEILYCGDEAKTLSARSCCLFRCAALHMHIFLALAFPHVG